MAQSEKEYALSIVAFLQTADKLVDVIQDKVTETETQEEKEAAFHHAIQFRESILSAISLALEELYILAQDTCHIPQDSWDTYDQLYRLVCSHESGNMDELMQKVKQIFQ